MAVSGSLADRQEFFASSAKLPGRFWDRSSARLMTEDGWFPAITKVWR